MRAEITLREPPSSSWLALCLLASACGGAELPVARNLLLISVDTLRADALGVYGGERGASPNLDSWSLGGSVFEQAFSHSPKTAPSHMTLLTGLLPDEHGVTNMDSVGAPELDPSFLTLAELLQAEGFATAAQTGGGNVKGVLGFSRGFEQFNDRGEAVEVALSKQRKRLERAQGAGRRWFHFFHTYHVHDPYLKGFEFVRRFVDPTYPGRILGDREQLIQAIQGGQDLAPGASESEKLNANFWRRATESDPIDQRHLHDLYLAGVASLDQRLGPWLEQAEQAGLLAATLVVLTSDHGEEFGEHGRLRHDQIYTEGTHVPLIVRHPDGLARGARISGLVGHRDFVPSVLELLGLEASLPAGLGGRSWARALLGAPLPALEYRSMHQSRRDRPFDWLAVRDDDSTWMWGPAGFVAFDRRRDPLERSPLAETDPRRVELESQARLIYADFLQHSTSAPGAPRQLNEESRRELEALGYLGDGE